MSPEEQTLPPPPVENYKHVVTEREKKNKDFYLYNKTHTSYSQVSFEEAEYVNS